MKISQANHADAAAIARVHVDSWRATYAQILPHEFLAGLSCEQRTSSWASALSDPEEKKFIFVADHPEDGIVGFASGGPERCGITGYSSELYAIYLLQTIQRAGVGRRLVASVARRLADSGHESLMVWVLADNPSRGFYEKLGGEVVAEKLIEIAGTQLIEVAYGWQDLSRLIQ